jgi:hypothetical protein
MAFAAEMPIIMTSKQSADINSTRVNIGHRLLSGFAHARIEP